MVRALNPNWVCNGYNGMYCQEIQCYPEGEGGHVCRLHRETRRWNGGSPVRTTQTQSFFLPHHKSPLDAPNYFCAVLRHWEMKNEFMFGREISSDLGKKECPPKGIIHQEKKRHPLPTSSDVPWIIRTGHVTLVIFSTLLQNALNSAQFQTLNTQFLPVQQGVFLRWKQHPRSACGNNKKKCKPFPMKLDGKQQQRHFSI